MIALIVILLIIILFIYNFKKQPISKIKSKKVIDKLNTEEYQIILSGNESVQQNADSVTRITDEGDGFKKHIFYNNNPFETIKLYSKETLNIKIEETIFYNFLTGIAKEYDSQGELIKEVNWDANYRFSVQQLIEKMMRQFNIDLLSRTGKGVIRGYDHGYFYLVILNLTANSKGQTRQIKIDGDTGKVISDNIFEYKEE